MNEESGLNFQFFSSNEAGKPAIRMSAAMFSGPVYAFAALGAGESALSGLDQLTREAAEKVCPPADRLKARIEGTEK